jgi:hypothetical protein
VGKDGRPIEYQWDPKDDDFYLKRKHPILKGDENPHSYIIHDTGRPDNYFEYDFDDTLMNKAVRNKDKMFSLKLSQRVK